jgi:hypothetical protein
MNKINDEEAIALLHLGHVQIVQAVISRLSTVSAGLKGLSITVSVGVLAVFKDQPRWSTAVLLLTLTVGLAVLDAFYLGTERHFVGESIRITSKPVEEWADLHVEPPTAKLAHTFRALSSYSIAGFYLPILASALIVAARSDTQVGQRDTTAPAILNSCPGSSK